MGIGAETTLAFGELLKQYRLAAGLTQEALAERAGVSSRNVQNLERGENRPLKDTARRLADAVGLDQHDRALLLTTAAPVPRRRTLTAAALPGERPALPSAAEPDTPQPGALTAIPAATPRHNLPAALSSFVGREREQQRVRALLGQARLVTLTGSGGVGKTRLAMAAAQDQLAEYRDGVWLVELAPLADPALLPAAVAQVLGPREEAGRPITRSIVAYLRDRCVLLVLDNCEHLVAACAELADALLRDCPDVHILATSREALDVQGERRYRVPSLSVPEPRHLPPPELAGSFEAVRLFVERVRERRDDFALTLANARAIAEICARLDGVPLAIELAAARVGSMSVEAIAGRLDDRFRLLTGGARNLPTRQRTLLAALDWSWELLGERERVLLARLAVFAGGWTLAAAETVWGQGPEQARPAGFAAVPSMERWAVLDGLDALVGKSLVQVDESGEVEGRYRLLETVRLYAAERLAAQGETAPRRDRHLQYFLALAADAAPRLRGLEQQAYFSRLETEHDNLRAALGWARQQENWEDGLRLAGALGRFWYARGYFDEGRHWLAGLLAGGVDVSPLTRGRALNWAANLAREQSDYEPAVALHEEALALRRAVDDTEGIAGSLGGLGIVRYRQGDGTLALSLFEQSLALFHALGHRQGIADELNDMGLLAFRRGNLAAAQALHEESLALFRDLGDTRACAITLDNLGNVAGERGDLAAARALHAESLALQRQVGDRRGIALSLGNLGVDEEHLGNLAAARALQEEALILRRELGDRWGIALSLRNLGVVARQQGDTAARALQAEALALRRELGDPFGIADSLEELARQAAARGAPRLGAQIWGAVATLRDTHGMARSPSEQPDFAQALAALAGALGEATRDAAMREGQALTLEQTIALAVGGDAPA